MMRMNSQPGGPRRRAPPGRSGWGGRCRGSPYARAMALLQPVAHHVGDVVRGDQRVAQVLHPHGCVRARLVQGLQRGEEGGQPALLAPGGAHAPAAGVDVHVPGAHLLAQRLQRRAASRMAGPSPRAPACRTRARGGRAAASRRPRRVGLGQLGGLLLLLGELGHLGRVVLAVGLDADGLALGGGARRGDERDELGQDGAPARGWEWDAAPPEGGEGQVPRPAPA